MDSVPLSAFPVLAISIKALCNLHANVLEKGSRVGSFLQGFVHFNVKVGGGGKTKGSNQILMETHKFSLV